MLLLQRKRHGLYFTLGLEKDIGCVSRGGEGVLLTMTLARGRKGQNAMIVYKKRKSYGLVFGLSLPMYGLYKYQRVLGKKRKENGDRWRYLALTVHRPIALHISPGNRGSKANIGGWAFFARICR